MTDQSQTTFLPTVPLANPLADRPRTPCRGCGAPMVWLRTEAGKAIPIDPEPVPNGNIVVREGPRNSEPVAAYVSRNDPATASEPRFVSHFATCVTADQFRRKR